MLLTTLSKLTKNVCISMPRTMVVPVTYCSSNEISNKLIISCKRKQFNFYSNSKKHNSTDEIILASKGWNDNKSKGDSFQVLADTTKRDIPSIPFEHINVAPELIEALKAQNIMLATEFQSQIIPQVRNGKNVIIAGETGCGKTFGYLLPLMENIRGLQTEELNTPKILILVPNRELAIQVAQVAKTLGIHLNLNVKSMIGGATKKFMMNPEFEPIDVLVGTPGVIGKLSSIGVIRLNAVQHTVLDEADTLLDDSFSERMESIMKRVTGSQTILTSATLPREMPAFFEPLMDSFVQIKSERLHKPLLNINQRFLRVIKSAKPSLLLTLVSKNKQPLIIFTNRNETCNWLAMFLRENNIECANINGDMNTHIRQKQWTDFSEGHVNILSATDVGSRGLNTTQVNQVLNYDFPLYTADYIHRIGRIGRLGSPLESKVINYVSGRYEVNLVQNIEMAIRTDSQLRQVDGNITKIVQKKILKNMSGKI